MASGDSLGSWDPLSHRAPGTSGPAYRQMFEDLLIVFNETDSQYTHFHGVLPQNYAGGNLEVHVFWLSDETTGNMKWDVSFNRREPGVYNVDDGGGFGTATTHTVTPPDEDVIIDTTFAISAANAGNPVAGEPFRIKVARDSSVGSNLADDVFLLGVELIEA